MKNFLSARLCFVAICVSVVPLVTLASKNALADGENFKSYQHYAEGISGQAVAAQNQLNPKETFKHYTDHPNETHYYGGVTEDKSNMSKAASAALPKSPAGHAVSSDFLTRPQFQINKKSFEITNSEFIEAHSAHIARGINDAYVDCHKKHICHLTYTQKRCQQSHPFSLTSNRTLHVHIKETQKTIKETFSGNMTNTGFNSNVFTLPHQGFITSAKLSSRSDNGYRHYATYVGFLNGIQFAVMPASQGDWMSTIHFFGNHLHIPVASDGEVQFHFSGYSDDTRFEAPYRVVLQSTKTQKTPQLNWVYDPQVPSYCQKVKSTCTEPGGTKTVDGVKVTEPCWQYQDTFQCGPQDSGECGQFQNQGCSQIGSQCALIQKGHCVLFDETWQCPRKVCTGQAYVCGKQTYCMSGDCVTQKPSQSSKQDFNKAISGMAVVNGAAEQVKKQQANIAIFTGEALQCRKDVVGFSNCCNKGGWGQDIKLAHCNDQEKKLGKAREDQRTYSLGTKCINKVLGVCIQHAEVYCVFDSRMAADVQIQGRVGQLHISMGEGDAPNCRGLSITELERLNFANMDLSNLYQGIDNQVNFPDQGKTHDAILKRIDDFYKRHQSHGGAG